MSNLLKEVENKIYNDSAAYQSAFDRMLTFAPITPAEHYRAGATEWAGKAQHMFTLLSLLRQYHQEARDGRELNHDAIIGKIDITLDKYKEVSK
jgi:hypothetical protein